MKNTLKNNNKQIVKNYSPIKLTVYGKVVELTASGSGTKVESSNGQGGCSADNSRQRC